MRLTLTQLVPRAAAQMAWDSTGYEEERSCRLRVPRNQHPLSQGDFSYQPNEALSCLEFLDIDGEYGEEEYECGDWDEPGDPGIHRLPLFNFIYILHF